MTTTLDARIEKDEKIAGGKARIAGHRITVKDIVIWYEFNGLSADFIASEYDLSLADVYAALAYYHTNPQEIDQAIEATEIFVNELKQQIPSKLKAKSGG